MALLNSNACVMKVELSISCQNLANKDLTSLSDPICILKKKDKATNKFHEVARTEAMKETLNPVFCTRLQLDYLFEEVQELKFKIYDSDNSTDTMDDDDYLGEAALTLGQIVSSKKKTVSLMHKKHTGKGSITVSAEEITDNRICEMMFKAHKLDNKDFFGKSDPYLEIWRGEPSGDWTLCHRTEVVKDDLNPVWKKFEVAHHLLAKHGAKGSLKLMCYDYDSDGGHDFIGESFMTFGELTDKAKLPQQFLCINKKKKEKKKSYTNSGTLVLQDFKIKKKYSFLDYLFGGTQLNFTVGIDFTGSNGDPKSPSSLHYMDPKKPNEYLQSLWAVGSVIQDYDYDKQFPAFGFGAKLRDGSVSHEFALNGNPSNPFCAGIIGIDEAYKQSIMNVQLWGPTCASPIIRHVSSFARRASVEPSAATYYVLMLLTDGALTDMDETKQAIVEASTLPISIIIIGVGNADFSSMRELDGDDRKLTCPLTGRQSTRDIVQFVPYIKYKNSSTAVLSKAVLGELPGQVTAYFKANGISPGIQKH